MCMHLRIVHAHICAVAAARRQYEQLLNGRALDRARDGVLELASQVGDRLGLDVLHARAVGGFVRVGAPGRRGTRGLLALASKFEPAPVDDRVAAQDEADGLEVGERELVEALQPVARECARSARVRSGSGTVPVQRDAARSLGVRPAPACSRTGRSGTPARRLTAERERPHEDADGDGEDRALAEEGTRTAGDGDGGDGGEVPGGQPHERASVGSSSVSGSEDQRVLDSGASEPNAGRRERAIRGRRAAARAYM